MKTGRLFFLLLLLAAVGLNACASVSAPSGTPDQLQTKLDISAVPPVGTYWVKGNGPIKLGPVTIENEVEKWQLDTKYLESAIKFYGTPETKIPLKLVFVNGPYIQKANNEKGYLETGEKALSGLTVTHPNNAWVHVVIPVGWLQGGVKKYDPGMEGCGKSMPNLKTEDYLTMIVGHELLVHGFNRANLIEKNENEECTALWFEGFLLENSSSRRFGRMLP